MLGKQIYVNMMDWLDVKKSWKRRKVDFVEIDAQRSNVGVSFYFFQKYGICVFLRTSKFFTFFLKTQVFHKILLKNVCGCWVQSLWILLGACLCRLGACLWIGWVHAWLLVACLTVGSFVWLEVALPDSR